MYTSMSVMSTHILDNIIILICYYFKSMCLLHTFGDMVLKIVICLKLSSIHA